MFEVRIKIKGEIQIVRFDPEKFKADPPEFGAEFYAREMFHELLNGGWDVALVHDGQPLRCSVGMMSDVAL